VCQVECPRVRDDGLPNDEIAIAEDAIGARADGSSDFIVHCRIREEDGDCGAFSCGVVDEAVDELRGIASVTLHRSDGADAHRPSVEHACQVVLLRAGEDLVMVGERERPLALPPPRHFIWAACNMRQAREDGPLCGL
jgi:hypothetical protein